MTIILVIVVSGLLMEDCGRCFRGHAAGWWVSGESGFPTNFQDIDGI
jgi:hypothetical protein